MSFDLNINNYTPIELIQMFELPSNFDNSIVEMKETKLKENINKNYSLNDEVKLKTIDFIVKAKHIILSNQNQNQSLTQDTLQKKIENFYNSSYDLKETPIENSNEHMVQMRKEPPYLSSFPSEFFPGIINPLKKRTIQTNLNIDTRFRDNYYSSPSTNFNITLPLKIDNIIQIQLTSIELPTTFYVISKQYGNNYFGITVNQESTVINIPDGNYDQNTVMLAINHQLSLLSAPYNNINFEINLTSGNTGTAQTIVGVITSPSEPITNLELNFQADKYGIVDTNTPLPLKFGWILGFRNGIYKNNLNYVSEGVVDVTGPRYMFLVLDDYNNNVNNCYYSAFNSSILNKNILARISLQSSVFNILEQNSLNIITTPRVYFGPVNLLNLNIQLLDEYGRIIYLNNMDYSFCVTLTTIYDL